MADEEVESIVLDVESPGGTVAGVAELADQVREIAQGGVKPISARVDFTLTRIRLLSSDRSASTP
jgi:ClpP class serine protease